VVRVPASDAPVARQADGNTLCRLCGAARSTGLFEKGGWTFVRCTDCGLVSLSPLPSPAEIEAHHEASYQGGAYAAFAGAESIRADIARHRLDLVRPLAVPGRWLDVGCSTGAFVAEAGKAGVACEGLELSPTAVAAARARGLAVHRGTVDTFTPAERYAVVTGFDVVEHVPDPMAFVARLRAWLAPDGLLVLTLPDIASAAARLLGRHWFYYAPPDHVHYFTPATIRRLLERGGFATIDVRPVRKPMTLAYAAGAVELLMPRLGPAARRLTALLPHGLRRWRLPLALGEMLVVARPPRS
jgi:2-polyprenyl-3-methyl-5-hydroxy-6-metoxy-1,4-benzoquinol methylase